MNTAHLLYPLLQKALGWVCTLPVSQATKAVFLADQGFTLELGSSCRLIPNLLRFLVFY